MERFKATDAGRLREEYNRLVEGLAQRGNLPNIWLSNPALPDDILKEAVPGNIRRAEHFLSVLKRLVQYLKGRLQVESVETEVPVAFVASINGQVGIDQKMLRFCYDRLHSLMITLEITDTDEFMHIQTVCNFATLVGTYTRGFSIIIEPFDERMAHIPDPVLQLPVSTKFDMRSDPGVVRNYGRLLLEMVAAVPDGMVCFFVSYSYMDGIVNSWNEMGILQLPRCHNNSEYSVQDIMQHKLVFLETQDVMETTLALENYRKACDSGRVVRRHPLDYPVHSLDSFHGPLRCHGPSKSKNQSALRACVAMPQIWGKETPCLLGWS
ncbi:DNA repair helicase UVH6 [Platanthera guangdongensis]|uniref:DNA 5'-3' helicase n=1 Tax=Platanthera guangdongensis TaxID=2320717 RepID=A0ABR2MNF5_9ASPA